MSVQSPNFQLYPSSQRHVIGRTDNHAGWGPTRLTDLQLVVGKADVGDGQNHSLTVPLNMVTEDPEFPGRRFTQSEAVEHPQNDARQKNGLNPVGTVDYQA